MIPDGTDGPGVLKPVLCAQLPAPDAVMEFQKCGCKGKNQNMITIHVYHIESLPI